MMVRTARVKRDISGTPLRLERLAGASSARLRRLAGAFSLGCGTAACGGQGGLDETDVDYNTTPSGRLGSCETGKKRRAERRAGGRRKQRRRIARSSPPAFAARRA